MFSDHDDKRTQLVERVISELKTLRYEGSPPQLDVRFSGDLAAPDDLFIEATLWAEKVRRNNYSVSNLYVNGGFRDGIVRLRQLMANDAGGMLRAGGSYDVGTREGSLQLHSGLDAQSLVRGFGRMAELEETVFYNPPEIDLTLRASFGERMSLKGIGHVALKKFAYKSLIFDGLNADVSWDGGRWSAIDVGLTHRTGRITGDMLRGKGGDRSSLKSTIPRKVLTPLAAGKAGEWISRIEFLESANADDSQRRNVAGESR